MDEKGPYPIADIKMEFSHGRADYMRIIGKDLGLDSRNIQLEYGKQGNYDLYFEYDQLPNLMIDSAVTPFNGAGGDNLILLPGFNINDLNTYKDLTIETERRRVDAGFSFVPEKHWKVGMTVSHETKQGTDIIGGPLGATGGSQIVGNTVSILLPEPIDYITNKLKLAMDYADEKKQLSLNYQMSLFDNQEESLSWENPFADPLPETRATTGRLALPPSNQFHQVSLSGAYVLTPTTRLTGLLSTGIMLQDENFLPYNTDPVNQPLPRDSLDGEVVVNSARVAVTSRPTRPLRLKASYKYDERDNKTPQEQYTYYFLDTNDPATTVINEPLSYGKHKVDLSAQYRFNTYLDTLVGYGYKHTTRTFSDVEENEENTLLAELKVYPRSDLDIKLKVSQMTRDSSDYQAESGNQNPLLRKYYMADVDQSTVGLSLYYMPNSMVTIGLSGDLLDEDYTDSVVGLTKADRTTYSLDLTLIPRKDISLYAFYTLEGYDTSQTGDDNPATAGYWYADIEDRVDSYGAGVKVSGIRGKIDVGADLVYTLAESDTNMRHDDPVTTELYPTLRNELTSFKIYALYRPEENMAMKLSYLYEVYESDDWALDGVDAISVAPNMILLGNESPEYYNSVVMASMVYRF